MEVDHKDLIDKNYMMFIELLRMKSVPLIKYLYDEQVLTEKQATKTMSQAAHTLRAIHMLDNMLTLETEAFNSLYAGILYTKLWTPADILEPNKRPHKAIYEAPRIPLPDVWPDENYFKELEEKGLEIAKVDAKDARMEEWYEESRKNNVYEMKAKTKGRVLIINNRTFDDKRLTRHGSEKDVQGLIKIFTILGFETDYHPDLEHDEMQELLDKECRKDHSDYNCFFLIIMTHGNRGVVFGTDGYKKGERSYNCLKIEDIKNQFYKVKSLERKPKVFIIQACQGTDRNTGLKEAENEEDDEEMEDEENDENTKPDSGNPTGDGKEGDDDRNQGADNRNQGADDANQAVDLEDNEGDNQLAGQSIQDDDDDDVDDDDDDEEEEEENRRRNRSEDMNNSITAEAPFHFFTAMSTTEGYYAYLNTTYGSWFIQALIFVISNYAWKEDLLTLMEKVNDLVRKARTEKIKKKAPKSCLQVSEINSTFIKRFFFFPGMPLETEKPKKAPKPVTATSSELV